MKEHRKGVPIRVVRADRWIARNNRARPRQPSYATLRLDDAAETDSRSVSYRVRLHKERQHYSS